MLGTSGMPRSSSTAIAAALNEHHRSRDGARRLLKRSVSPLSDVMGSSIWPFGYRAIAATIVFAIGEARGRPGFPGDATLVQHAAWRPGRLLSRSWRFT